MLTRIPIAFLAGLISVVSPCVLPLVPGYLSAVSAMAAGRLREPGAGRRVAASSLPFFLGFTLVFVVLGAGAAVIAELLGSRGQAQIAGFVLVAFGLGFMGLLPLPKRIVAPTLISKAQRRGSGALLGAAFAVCAAPCIGGVLAGILVLAGDSGSIARASVLLAVYSAGIACAFLIAGVAFARALGAFRWLRDRYAAIQIGSGAMLLTLGLLLFFGYYGWLLVYFRRALDALGVGDAI
ncbi:MAG: cytochrome c biogenesis protein CcdA [Actinobacteria bacterium]|nr:cytochrome c biogenesis protein CcdA [Actinomycetota bacterium]